MRCWDGPDGRPRAPAGFQMGAYGAATISLSFQPTPIVHQPPIILLLKCQLAVLRARPLEKHSLNLLVEHTLLQPQANANQESWKNRWEYVLRKAVFDLAMRSSASTVGARAQD